MGRTVLPRVTKKDMIIPGTIISAMITRITMTGTSTVWIAGTITITRKPKSALRGSPTVP